MDLKETVLDGMKQINLAHHRTIAGSCTHGNKSSGCIKSREFDYLSVLPASQVALCSKQPSNKSHQHVLLHSAAAAAQGTV